MKHKIYPFVYSTLQKLCKNSFFFIFTFLCFSVLCLSQDIVCTLTINALKSLLLWNNITKTQNKLALSHKRKQLNMETKHMV